MNIPTAYTTGFFTTHRGVDLTTNLLSSFFFLNTNAESEKFDEFHLNLQSSTQVISHLLCSGTHFCIGFKLATHHQLRLRIECHSYCLNSSLILLPTWQLSDGGLSKFRKALFDIKICQFRLWFILTPATWVWRASTWCWWFKKDFR